MPRNADYIDRERFIHDDLLVSAERLVGVMRAEWRKSQAVTTIAFAWPSEAVKADDGSTISHLIWRLLPSTMTEPEKLDALRHLVIRAKAYGVALVERRNDELRVLFETHHGARAWLIPLERHGDVLVPGQVCVRDDAECLGLLWRTQQRMN